MASSKIQSSLLSKGYFPKELPEAFTTKTFGENSREIISEWNKAKIFSVETKALGKLAGKKVRRGSYTYSLASADAEIISVPKRGYERRNLQLTHPVSQSLIAHEMAQHWGDIQRWIGRQTYSLDEIRVSDQYERSVKGINFPLHREKKSYIESTSDWVVRTDITRFYPSIYTHSIPWAAYGKEKVKQNINVYKESLADRLDVLVRSGNRNQTVGIPIGPETSRIIAETISARIDSEFRQSRPEVKINNVDRLQDDWLIGTNSLESADSILAEISRIYRHFGLEINGSKTSINHIVAARQESWVSEIGAFLSHRGGSLSGSRLREFLAICPRLQAEFHSEPVINYALSVIEGAKIQTQDVREMESFLLKASIIAPNSLDRICRIILDLQHETNMISKKRVVDRFVELIERNIEKEHHFEVIWLIYTIRGLNVRFYSRKLSDKIESMQSASIALLLLDMRARKTFGGKLPIEKWESEITEDRILTDWTWLLGYEGFRNGWLRDKNNLMKGSLFAPMAHRNVVFYDPKRNVRPSKTFVSKRMILRNDQKKELRQFFVEVRGVDPFDY
jgi:hypothetical protein